ncbi:uncharacterized protein TRUGW13939_11996 [Talaromyces rugulosus]|uniref:Peptidase C14 caspase domain-containing protein n=1 Tax=Talaromyces rugulosus TaxID=121627 RepID=A0A7H8REA3_TALRU|nr:uncharacterized protein TRUGW13939_11996 [Talaromyces rugulosus]QKX64820.1 hypothetical protein TRUGW13939_11996 [Talaromyces rugulosus]
MSALPPPGFWAVLIGIDHYDKYKPLRGCVSDIENIERLLHDTVDSTRLQVYKITAAVANEPHPPTYKNIMDTFQEVKRKAAPGDFFYLHYSGHGGRQQRKEDPQYPQHHAAGGEMYESLVLHGDKHLKDYELGQCLDGLADAGVKTFAVLDCCHSGGADRVADDTIRGLDHVIPPDEDDNDVLPHYPEEESDATTQEPSRDGSAKASYWTRARKYTLLAACQPHEYARECEDQNGERHGALTYTMLRSIAKLSVSGVIPTYKTLYWDIAANIFSVSSTQHPMLFGERDIHLFGSTSHQSTRLAVVNRIDGDRRLYISRGEAHGVRVGEEYAVHPRGAFDLSQIIAKIRINSVGMTRASAKIPPMARVEQGCPVSLVTPVITDLLRVKVQSPELLQELQQRTGSTIQFNAYDSRDATHQVLFQDQSHQIVDATGTPLSNCPLFPANGEAATKIYTFLQKFAHYRMVAQLHNEKSHLNASFVFQERDGIDDVFHEESINLVFKNLKPPPPIGSLRDVLYFSVLNLRDNWEVALVIPDPDDTDDSIAVGPGETSDQYDMEMTIRTPQQSELDDIFMTKTARTKARVDVIVISVGIH